MHPMVDRVVSFGPFRLHLDRRMLLEDERSVRLGSRALEILIALVEHAGELVRKDALMASVWPDLTVEESNIKVHIAALRRALADRRDGNRYILTVPGQGYRFIATISPAEGTGTASAPFPNGQHALPSIPTKPAGCSDGTTRVALATTGTLLFNYENGLWLVDFVPLAEPQPTSGRSALAAVRKRYILDSSGHVFGSMADPTMAVLRDVPLRNILVAAP